MSGLDRHLPHLKNPPIEYRPELRWWLAEGLHTDETLRREIDTAHRLGFGGMEFLAMDEQNIDHARYAWGSEEWVHDSHIVVEELTARDMALSFTSGTNWSNANLPTITPDHPAAAQELNYVTEKVAAEGRRGPLPRIDLQEDRSDSPLPGHRVAPELQHLQAVIAAPVTEGTGAPVVDVAAVIDLTASVTDGALDWTPPDARSWKLFVFWRHGTGQTAEPSASVNYTVNYLDRDGVDAVIEYWRDEVLTDELKRHIAANDRAQMYMDSLELSLWGAGGMFWGKSVADEFRARRGYDITPWLPLLVRTTVMMSVNTEYHYEADEAHRLDAEKVRHDYVETLTDLYIENMLRPFAAFLHDNGILLRSEISYGLPFELTRPGPEVDGIETESLEFASQIDAYRLLAGPAHLFGKQYSSETGATTRNHMLPHAFYDQIIATQLAAGITKTVLHGWASTAGAPGTTWPGHEGMWNMFSERFDTRQPAAEFYPLWNDAIGRYQYLLRQGRPRIDIGILRTDHFVDNMFIFAMFDDDGNRIVDEDFYATKGMRNRENQWWQDPGMQDAGWSYEFLDGQLLLHEDVSFADGLVQPDGPGYQALIVYQEALDADVAAKLLAEARAGLRILLVNNVRELRSHMNRLQTVHPGAALRTPGLDGRDEELAATMATLRALPTVAEIDDPAQTVAALRGLGVAGRAEFTTDNPNVLTYLRDDGDLTHLYAYNFLYETGETTEVSFSLDGVGAAHRIDPWTGTVLDHPAEERDGRTVVTLTLAPGETALLTLDRSQTPAPGAAPAVEVLAEPASWGIVVEGWDEGPYETITEDRGLGYITTEVRPTTAITRHVAGSDRLAPWSELDGVGSGISGVGEYVTEFTLGEITTGRYLLSLGSTCGGLGSVSLNDSAPVGFDTSVPVVDVTGLVVAGTNRLVVRVSSSLNNVLLARGYYDDLPDVASQLSGMEELQRTHVRDYGLVGPVRVVRELS
ncbi:glycosyl hydrolase [Tessaracoccus defluvii]|uniref:Alpha-L-rhamnosidase n=1 Tax=Tessaracoccus defluvii TaxID=1285901 RepID=A0A7H0H9G6_9ACTN|nr:glycosyl hydrolase [Tessaracoccus defluvii]QNP57182.1 hypothetical protein H9L22_07925 [Tessaracoccus defluvii]